MANTNPLLTNRYADNASQNESLENSAQVTDVSVLIVCTKCNQSSLCLIVV